MSAAFPIPAVAHVSTARVRFIPVIGDSMEPTLKRNNMVAVVPVSGYRAEGLYVLDVLGQPNIVRCQALSANSLRVWHDNPAYGGNTVTREWFEEALLGKVAAVLEITDRSLLEA